MSGEINYSPEEFQTFKKVFVIFLTEECNACPNLQDSIRAALTFTKIKNILRSQDTDEVFEALGIDPESKCDNCSNMKNKVEQKEEEMKFYKSLKASLADENKFNSFTESRNNYSPIEFDDLMKNGKHLLTIK